MNFHQVFQADISYPKGMDYWVCFSAWDGMEISYIPLRRAFWVNSLHQRLNWLIIFHARRDFFLQEISQIIFHTTTGWISSMYSAREKSFQPGLMQPVACTWHRPSPNTFNFATTRTFTRFYSVLSTTTLTTNTSSSTRSTTALMAAATQPTTPSHAANYPEQRPSLFGPCLSFFLYCCF